MATGLDSGTEVILYPTRATRRTGEFSRRSLEKFFRQVRQPEQNFGAFRLSVTWGTEETFTIRNLPTIAGTDSARPEPG